MIRAFVTISGSFQGDCFSRHAVRFATEVRISGWVRTCGQGTIEACFEGRRRAVEAMISWCFIGPSQATVDAVIVRRKRYRGSFSGFRIMADRDADWLQGTLQPVDSWRGSTAAWRSS